MSNKKSALRNIVKVAFSQGVSLLSGIVAGFLLPKILSVEGYGYLKIYTLYIAYTALLHFGFVDGILLKLAGKDYEKLDKREIRTYTHFFTVFQLIVGITMSIIGIVLQCSEYSFIMLMLGINMIIINVTSYYQFISQATQRFTDFAAKNVIGAVLKISLVLALLVMQTMTSVEVSYRIYIIVLNIIDGSILLWYIFVYRDISFGNMLSLAEVKRDIFSIFKQGIILTIAYQVSHLVLVLDRQFVSVLFPTETYALYSFAYNIVTLITTMVSSLSIVLFPMLKRVTREVINRYYEKLLSVVAVMAGASIACYFPFAIFIKWFLPNYENSIVYLRIVLPALMFSCCISIVMFTFSKILDTNIVFFKNGCIALILGFVTNAVAHMLFKSPEAISYASLVTMALWFVIEGKHIGNKVNGRIRTSFCYISILSIGFIIITILIRSCWVGIVIYLLFYIIVSVVVYHTLITKFLITRLKQL